MRFARAIARTAGIAIGVVGLVMGSVYTARQRQRIVFYRDFTAELANLVRAYREQLARAGQADAQAVPDLLAAPLTVAVQGKLGTVEVVIRHNGIDKSHTVRCRVTSDDRALLAVLAKMLRDDSKGLEVLGVGMPQPASPGGYQLLFGISVLSHADDRCLAANAKLEEAARH